MLMPRLQVVTTCSSISFVGKLGAFSTYATPFEQTGLPELETILHYHWPATGLVIWASYMGITRRLSPHPDR